MNSTNNVLVDSSVWIDYFKKGKSNIIDDVNLLLDEDRVVLCGMVELEILQGLRGKEHVIVQELFQALHFIESERKDFVAAGLILNQLRSKGVPIPASDCLIAAQCIRHNIPIFTLDNDFKCIHALKKFK